MNLTSKVSLLCVAILLSIVTLTRAQSREGLIQLEYKNYITKQAKGQVRVQGDSLNGKRHGLWQYHLIYDDGILYYQGNYINGAKEGVWNNYALIPPMEFSNNEGLIRSTEVWKDDKLYRYKMGQDNLLILIPEGLSGPVIDELRRLDEAFEYSYRRTSGKTITPEFGESVESMQQRLIPLLRQQLLLSNKKAELKSWSLFFKLKLHESYDSGRIVKSLVQSWEADVLYSKEIYENEVLTEKSLYIMGNPDDVIYYEYYPQGNLKLMHHYLNDTIPTGKWLEYYPGGEKKLQGTYSNGRRKGKWKFWDENQNLEVIKYKDGEVLE